MSDITKLSMRTYLEKLASDAPTPGGGSASAMAGALAAALASMVANLTIGKKKFAACEAEAVELEAQATQLREKMLQLSDEDAKAFQAFMACYRLPKNTEEEQWLRKQYISAAAKNAAAVPYQIAETALDILRMTVRLGKIGNPNVVSDATVSALLARAALRGSVYNVLINLKLTADPAYNVNMENRLEVLQAEAVQLERLAIQATSDVIEA